MKGQARAAFGLLLAVVTSTAFMTAAPLHASEAAQSAADASPPSLREAIVAGSSRSAGGSEIQLGAYRDEETAAQAWHRIAVQIGPPLDSRQPQIVPVDLPGKGRFWRLRLSFHAAADAKAVCAVLKSRGVECFLSRN